MTSLIAVDIGNSGVKAALLQAHQVRHLRRLSLRASESTIHRCIQSLCEGSKPYPSVLSSVVPAVTSRWKKSLQKIAGCSPLLITFRLPYIFQICYEPVESVGSDRLVACEAAVRLYGVPVAVFSFGTALAISAVDRYYRFIGGFLFPGYSVASRALSASTALLKKIPPRAPSELPGSSTASGISSGLYHGFVGVILRYQTLLKHHLGEEVRFVATGGDAISFAPLFSFTNEHLTLFGMEYLFYEIHAGRRTGERK